MKCRLCGFDNKENAKFCGSCGVDLAPHQPDVRKKQQIDLKTTGICPSCGYQNEAGSNYCETCGAELAGKVSERPIAEHQQAGVKKRVSSLWWLVPLLFSWVGGIIAWLVVREVDKVKAKHLLIAGIAVTVFWFFLAIVGNIIIPTINSQRPSGVIDDGYPPSNAVESEPYQEEIKVPINFVDANDVGAIHFVVSYDTSVLELISVTKSAQISDALFEYENYDQVGNLTIKIISTSGIEGSGYLADMLFTVLDGDGFSPLEIGELLAFDTTFEDIIAVEGISGGFNGGSGWNPKLSFK
jgi:hypothetical protein